MVKISDIAGWVGAKAPSVDTLIARVSGISDATSDSLVFATDPKSLDRALRSEAAGILADLAMGGDLDAYERVLLVKDAKLAFSIVAARLRARPGQRQIHPRALVEDELAIGERTLVGPGAVIGRGVTVGRDCEILANATLYPGTIVGDRVIVQSGAVLGSTGFGYVKYGKTGEYVPFPQQGTLIIEDDVEIGANTTVDRGALGETRIGQGTKIDNLVHIAHNCVIGKNVVIAAQTGISGSTVVEDGAIIGGQVGIGDHAIIGEGVILGSGSGVLSNKKLRGPGQVFWGVPAQPLMEYLHGLARFRRQ